MSTEILHDQYIQELKAYQDGDRSKPASELIHKALKVIAELQRPDGFWDLSDPEGVYADLEDVMVDRGLGERVTVQSYHTFSPVQMIVTPTKDNEPCGCLKGGQGSCYDVLGVDCHADEWTLIEESKLPGPVDAPEDA